MTLTEALRGRMTVAGRLASGYIRPVLRLVNSGALLALLVCAAGALAAELPPSASARGAEHEGRHRVQATLLLDVEKVRPGDTFRVGIHFRMEPRWHIYWRNPGDSGLSTKISWDAPGVEQGPLQWPFPDTFRTTDGFIVTHGYADEVLLFTTARASEEATGALTISAAADLLVCEVNCIPAELVVTRPLPIGQETVADPAAAAVFQKYAVQVPQPADAAGYRVAVNLEGPLRAGEKFNGSLELVRKDGGALTRSVQGDFFVPERIEALTSVSLGKPTAAGVFPMSGVAGPDATSEPVKLAGVLRLGTRQSGFQVLEVEAPLAPLAPAAASAPESPSEEAAPKTPTLALPLALLFAFLGGVILNLMPCVFPVLALKVYGFTRIVQEEGGRKGLHAVAYAGGILFSMAALAGAVVAVRAAGRGVGWGFQFQEPLFVALVCAVLVAFALNLFGVFDVGQPGSELASKVDHSHGPWRSAGEGVLAVVLATPCSAPLLGTAVGFAIAAGAFATFAVFLMIGLGLAAPFCLLVFVPSLARRLPKPGAWMERVKQLLGFALLATAVWLVWVLGGLAGVDGMARLLAFLLAVSLSAWVFGLAQRRQGMRKAVGVIVAGLLLVLSGLPLLRFEAPTGQRTSGMESAQPWEEKAVASALKAGQPVFVDFTADWCLTCKFNERTVLATTEVQRTFAEKDVAVFVADWTRRDERISRELERHGRAGVPMYLVLSPHRPNAPELLPEVITPQIVVDALARASEEHPN